MLLDAGADVNAEDENSRTVMHNAVGGWKSSQIPVLQLLIDVGADVNKTCRGSEIFDRTALSSAVHEGDLPAVKVLLDAGARPGSYSLETSLCRAYNGVGRHKSSLQSLDHRKLFELSKNLSTIKFIFILQLLVDAGVDTGTLDNKGREELKEILQIWKELQKIPTLLYGK
jgi:hypothetical protein